MTTFFNKYVCRQRSLFQRAMCTESRFQPRLSEIISCLRSRRLHILAFDPFRYTQGHWLDRDKERRDARTLHFNFDALMDVAVKSIPGARRVTHCEKKEGGFNRVFMVHLDNKHTVVARLPTRLAGPPTLALSSEVATLRYVKEKTTIPVPTVLSWRAGSENSVGTEYMVLDTMPGVPLKDVWNNMKASQHVACIISIGRMCKQLCKLSFPVYGSLYLNTDAPPGAVRLDETFCIGPVCAPQHWGCGIDSATRAEPPSGHQGPWCNIEDYFSDLITRARTSLYTESNGSGTSHMKLLGVLQQSLDLLTAIESVKSASGATLFHPDFHTRNIFVDSGDYTRITGIIDWQSAAIEPAFVFASETPDFAQELAGEEDSSDMTEEELAAYTKLRSDVDFCDKTWVVMQQTCEKLRPASRLDPTFLQVLAAPSFGWISKEISLDMLLDNLAKSWKQLGLPGQSIYKPYETGDLEQRLDEYHASRQMQDHLTRLLRCDDDGWVPNDRWQEVLLKYRLEYSRFVESVIDSEDCESEEHRLIAVEKANRLWPYDQR